MHRLNYADAICREYGLLRVNDDPPKGGDGGKSGEGGEGGAGNSGGDDGGTGGDGEEGDGGGNKIDTSSPEFAKVLGPRLERAKKKEREVFYKAMGVKDETEFQAFLAKRKEEEDKKKSQEQLLADRDKELGTLKPEVEDLRSAVKARFEALTKNLSEEQKEMVPTGMTLGQQVTWLEKAIARGMFGKPDTTGSDDDDTNKGGLNSSAPGGKGKGGKRIYTPGEIAVMPAAEYEKQRGDISLAYKEGRIKKD